MPNRLPPSTRHLDLLCLLSKRPAKIDSLSRDLGIAADRITALRGDLLRAGVNTIELNGSLRVTASTWATAKRLATAHLAYADSRPRLGSPCR